MVAGADEVHFGKVGCLVDVTRTLTLQNVSLIPAPFKTFIKTTRSKFKVDILEGVLAPDEKVTLTLTANLDDALPHKDELHVVVTDGDNLSVTLKAIGTGTTLHCDHDVSTVDFGHVFTTNVCEHTFVMENKGRRVQSIQWINATLRDMEAEERRKVCVCILVTCVCMWTMDVRVCAGWLVPCIGCRLRSLTRCWCVPPVSHGARARRRQTVPSRRRGTPRWRRHRPLPCSPLSPRWRR